MAESTLSLTWQDYMTAVGRKVGWVKTGAIWSAMSAARQTETDRLVQEAYRQFLDPPLVLEDVQPHQWTFLTPIQTIDVTSGTEDYEMPDDFAGLIGRIWFPENELKTALHIVGRGQILSLRSSATNSGYPRYAAITPLPRDEWTDGTGQRFQLMIYPTPDADYTFAYTANIITNKMDSTDANKYPIGGEKHAETILASCLERAENYIEQAQGAEYARWIQRLRASIMIDLDASAPETMGMLGDRNNLYGNRYCDRSEYVSFEGNIPGLTP